MRYQPTENNANLTGAELAAWLRLKTPRAAIACAKRNGCRFIKAGKAYLLPATELAKLNAAQS